MINYCLPIIVSEVSEVEGIIKTNNHRYQYFEVWLDYLDDFETDWVRDLVLRHPGRLLVLFRRRNLEPIKMSFSKRKEILSNLNNLPCYVDIDYKTQIDEMEFLQTEDLNLELILSFHNYQFTPSKEDLRQIITDMQKFNPAICKIACFCQQRRDALRLLELRLELDREGVDSIILGMGEHGVATRIFGTIWGNKMIFAPNSKQEESAPMQLDRNDLENMFNTLGKFYGW